MVYKDININNLESDLIDTDAIKASVRNIILLEVGELLGMPEFGVKIRSMLFEQFNMFTSNSLQTMILHALYKYESRISSIDVRVVSEPSQHKIICSIGYTIDEINIQDNVSIRLT